MKDKKKAVRNYAIVMLSLACVVFAGVFIWKTRQPVDDVVEAPAEIKQEQVEPEVKAPEIVQISLTEELQQSDDQAAVSDEIIIAIGEVSEVQPIQEAPVEAAEPTEPPALAEGTDLTDPDKVPEYVEDPKPTEKPDDTVVTRPPQDGGHPGQIYVEGFGWIDRGEPNESTYDAEMYMNGNKIGDM